MIPIHYMEYFVAVAETLHFGRAAERLHLSQPALSQQIRRLEKQIGVTLLERNRRGVWLTPAGRAFLAEARKTLDQVGFAVREAQRAGHGEPAPLRVGFVGSVLYSFMPQVIATFRRQDPDVVVTLCELSSQQQVQGLLAHELDVGVVYPPIAEAALNLEVVLRAPVWLALPRRHPLAARKSLRWQELEHEAFILVSQAAEPALYAHYAGFFNQLGFTPRVAQEANQVQTILGLVATGVGLFPAPAYVSHIRHAGVVYVPLRAPVFHLELALAWRATDATRTVAAFVDLTRALTKSKAPRQTPAY